MIPKYLPFLKKKKNHNHVLKYSVKKNIMRTSYWSFSKGIFRIPVIYLRQGGSKWEIWTDVKAFILCTKAPFLCPHQVVNNDRVVYTSKSRIPGLMKFIK